MSEWIKTAKVGDRVVCMLPVPTKTHGEILPQVGGVYTIREIYVSVENVPALYLAQIYNTPRQYRDAFGEAGFFAWHFKPVAPQQKSIDALAALTNKPDPNLVEHIPFREAIEQ